MRVFLVAGEPSGDRLGAALMEGLDDLMGAGNWEPSGVGGPLMEARGLNPMFPMDEIAIMGVTNILRNYGALKKRIAETAEAAVASRADVVVTIDIPEFSLRVAKAVKAASPRTPTIHYVAPSVWAWRPGRARRMARHVDHVLALLPFEPPYMTAAGMGCDFVGHPVVAEPQATTADIAAFRSETGLGDAPTLLLLPGSRASELDRLLPIFAATVERLHAARPDLRYVIPAASPRIEARLREAVAKWPVAPVVLAPAATSDAALMRKRAAFRAANVALAASGTVSLELAAAGTPMVIAYDMGWLSRMVIGGLLRIDTLTLVNLVTGTHVIPEFIGRDCRPDAIAPEVLKVLADPGRQIDAMTETMRKLGQGGEAPGLRAARAVKRVVERARTTM